MSRPIADVLRDLAGGTTYDELTTALGEIVTAVQETGKSGELTLKLKVKPNGQGCVILQDEIKTKIPAATRGETIFFATSGGSLVRQDPRQQDLPLRTVAAATPAAGTGD